MPVLLKMESAQVVCKSTFHRAVEEQTRDSCCPYASLEGFLETPSLRALAGDRKPGEVESGPDPPELCLFPSDLAFKQSAFNLDTEIKYVPLTHIPRDSLPQSPSITVSRQLLISGAKGQSKMGYVLGFWSFVGVFPCLRLTSCFCSRDTLSPSQRHSWFQKCTKPTAHT